MGYLQALFLSTTIQLSLPPGLLSSICYIESKHKIQTIRHNDGGSDSIGICQIKLKTAQWLGFKGTAQELLEPTNNIYYAGKYLALNLKKYHTATKAVIAYNQGHVNASQTNTNYQSKVFEQWRNANNDSLY